MTSQRDSTRNFGGSATFGESLDDALVSCLRGLLSWLHATAGISESEAYALSNMAVNFRIAQNAHQTGSAETSVPPKVAYGVAPRRPDRAAPDRALAPSRAESQLVMRTDTGLRPTWSEARPAKTSADSTGRIDGEDQGHRPGREVPLALPDDVEGSGQRRAQHGRSEYVSD